MPWYAGESLLEHLESVPAANGLSDGPARLPVQYVIRADGTRWYAGRLAGGTLSVGDDIVVLPSGTRTRVAAFEDGEDTAAAPRSIAVVARGRARRRPRRPARRRRGGPGAVRELSATLCWLGDEPARPGARYLVKHTTRFVPAKLEAIEHRLDVTTLEHEPADELDAQRDRPRPPAARRAARARLVRAAALDRRLHRR